MEQRVPLKISILIPTWNRVAPVLEAVESVALLSDDMEIVIVDNASDPAVFAELQRLLGSRRGICLYRNEFNLGMVKNWNRCLEYSRGEWLGLLCSDDRYRPGAIQRLQEIVALHPEPSLIIQDPSNERELEFLQAGSETVRGLRLPIASGNFWHRSVYKQVGGFDERFEYSADAEYWYRAAFSFPVVKVRNPFAVYVAHEDNYMWATWRRPDYLQQTELLARTVGAYSYAAVSDRDVLIDRHVKDSIWQTLLSIIASSFLAHGKSDITQYYVLEALRQAGSFRRKGQLLKTLISATVHRGWAALCAGGRKTQ